jgi:hypothetical protein
VATVLFLAAATIGLWPTEQAAKAAPKSEAPTLSIKPIPASSPAQTELSEAEHSPTRFTNPFDVSEIFEFPPGTPEDTARASVAETLLLRARERGTQVGTPVRHVHDRRSPPMPTPALLSESLFKKMT